MFNKYTREKREEALKPAAETGAAAAAAGWTSDLIPFMDEKGRQKQCRLKNEKGQPSATRSRLIYCRKATPSIRGNSIVTSIDGNVRVGKLTRQCGNPRSLKLG